MKTTSKILCALLVLTMVFAMFSVSASAEAVQIATTDGNPTDIVGIPAGATVTYLSDVADALVDYRTLLKGAAPIDNEGNEIPVRNNESYYLNSCTTYIFAEGIRVGAENDKEIRLGYNGTLYEKGLGVWAGSKKADMAPKENYLTYSVAAGATKFYAVTGNNGNNSTRQYGPIRFELWGGNAKDGEFTLLAYAECLNHQVAEFNVDITGYSFIKLVQYQAESATEAGGDLNALWANAAFYAPAATGGETPSTPTTPPKTADSFTMTAVAALVVAATSVTALVVSKKKFF